MSRRNYRNKEAPYEFYNVPDCKPNLEGSVLLKISSRQQLFPYTDDPITGYMIRRKDTGWMQGFVVLTTFTTWQQWFKFDSLSEYGQLENGSAERLWDHDGSLSRELEAHERIGDTEKEGVVWTRVGEISLLGALRCGRWLMKLVIEELEYNGDYDCLVLQATDESIPFYESLGFIRIGAVAKYVPKGKTIDQVPIVPYRHWTYPDQLVSKMPGPSYMMAKRLRGCRRKTRSGRSKRVDVSRYLATKAPKIVRTPPSELRRVPTTLKKRRKRKAQPSAELIRKRKLARGLKPGEILVRIRCNGLNDWLAMQRDLYYFEDPTTAEAKKARALEHERIKKYGDVILPPEVRALKKKKSNSAKNKRKACARNRSKRNGWCEEEESSEYSDSAYESAVSVESDEYSATEEDSSASDWYPEDSCSSSSRRKTRKAPVRQSQRLQSSAKKNTIATPKRTSPRNRNNNSLEQEKLKERELEQLRLLNKVVKISPNAQLGAPLRSTRARLQGKRVSWRHSLSPKKQKTNGGRTTRSRSSSKDGGNSTAKYFFVARYDFACVPPHCQLIPMKGTGRFNRRGPRSGRIRWKLVESAELGVEAKFCTVVDAEVAHSGNGLDPQQFSWDIFA
eukprot:g1069.t1